SQGRDRSARWHGHRALQGTPAKAERLRPGQVGEAEGWLKSVDTNVLARFFIDDPDDSEAKRQRPASIKVMRGAIWVSVTVLLEFEWVMRGFYELPRAAISAVLRALCTLENV